MPAVTNQRICIHCGTSFRPTEVRPDFCCAGCQFVHGLIAQHQLGQFYDLQERGIPPASSIVFQKRDYDWLEELARQARGELILDVQGMSCLGCAWLIERLFSRHDGALSIQADPAMGRLHLRWQEGVFDPVSFARELQSFGYLVGPPGKASPRASRALSLRLGICAALAMNTMLFSVPHYAGMEAGFEFAPLFQRLTLILGTLSFVIGGSYFFARAWSSLRRGFLHLDFPISLGLVAAYAGSVTAWVWNDPRFAYFDFVSTFTFLMLAGRWLQQKAVERNRHQLLETHAEPPSVLFQNGERAEAASLKKGDLMLVEPGRIVPVLSRLRSEAATLGMEWIRGESEVCVARKGRLVPAGATNCGPSPLELEACEPWADSLLAKLLRAAPPGASRDAALERFLRRYLMVVVFVALGGFVAWWMTAGAFLMALQVFVSVLVVSCPCASGVALPLCRDLATAELRRLGVFIRDGGIWAKLARVRKVIFDKTGTLTLEAMSLLNPAELRRLSTEERAILLAMVQDSRHPVSGCLREQLLADHVEPACVSAVEEVIGFGIEAECRGAIWRLGRAGWAAAGDAEPGCAFTRDGKILATFHFGETARADAALEIAALRARGCEIYLLSGDRRGKVEAMAARLHLPAGQCFGELSPAEKAGQVQRIDDRDTLYLGDGANDSLAFDAALVSGTPAIDRGLLEQKANFYFLGQSLGGVRALLEVADRRRRAASAVVAFAIFYNAIAVALCLAGLMNPLLAAILMPLSSLVSLGLAAGYFRRSFRRLRTRNGESPAIVEKRARPDHAIP